MTIFKRPKSFWRRSSWRSSMTLFFDTTFATGTSAFFFRIRRFGNPSSAKGSPALESPSLLRHAFLSLTSSPCIVPAQSPTVPGPIRGFRLVHSVSLRHVLLAHVPTGSAAGQSGSRDPHDDLLGRSGYLLRSWTWCPRFAATWFPAVIHAGIDLHQHGQRRWDSGGNHWSGTGFTLTLLEVNRPSPTGRGSPWEVGCWHGRGWLKGFAGLSVAAVWAVGLGAAQFLPFAEFVARSNRSGGMVTSSHSGPFRRYAWTVVFHFDGRSNTHAGPFL